MPFEDDLVHNVSKVVSGVHFLFGDNTLALYNQEVEFKVTFLVSCSICTSRLTAHILRKPAALDAPLPGEARPICRSKIVNVRRV